ncbi:hypothetical protein F2Q68_00024624 [Brassica cretica]|uniref:Uncharacterized protein n=1 Tax=Brassica cretica TaxID=69181 RepID=A0A8S9I8W1_BRACR|nr:hypothetical protein F2Q68_00024624 [Brassica cretica]
MRFRRWDPGRVRVGNEKDIPNLHQDYGTSKQRKEQDDFIRGDLSGWSGFRGIFENIGIVWGCDLLTESTDLGSSIGGVLDNQGKMVYGSGIGFGDGTAFGHIKFLWGFHEWMVTTEGFGKDCFFESSKEFRVTRKGWESKAW